MSVKNAVTKNTEYGIKKKRNRKMTITKCLSAKKYSMTPDHEVLKEHLKGLNYLFDLGVIKDGFFGRVIGFNVSASSLLRKNYTLQRIQKEIEEFDLPLEVDDCLGEGYKSFRLLIK